MKTYEDGLNEAWELTRKLIISDYDGAYSAKDMRDIWEHGGFLSILKDFTAQQALEKLKKYENHKEIEVGDEVVDKYGWKRVVISINGEITFMNSDGSFSEYCKRALSDFKKTGRHFPQIEEMLKQMQESDE